MAAALADPREAFKLLEDAGVKLTDEEKRAIEVMVLTGNTAAAQKFILDKLTASIGGTADAYGKTLPGYSQEEEKSWSLSAGVDRSTQYLFRGSDLLDDEPVRTPESGGLNVPLVDADQAADQGVALAAQRLRLGRGASGKHLRIVDALALGTRERLLLVDVAGERVLLGVAGGRIERLHVLEAPTGDFSSALEAAQAPAPGAA